MRPHRGLTDSHKDIIKQRIEALLPMKSLAADPDVANIEIVSDAAMSFLDAYNLEHMMYVVPFGIRPQKQLQLLIAAKESAQPEVAVHQRAGSRLH